MEEKPRQQQKESLAKFKHGNEIFESNFKQNTGQDNKY
jgi:hypothetical protein